MSTTVYLVRHAEAEGNIGRRCHGIYNSLLTRRGRRQAKTVGDRFRTIPLDGVYSSDLARARDTARAIAQPHGLEVIQRPLLREIDMGDWEDRPWAELAMFEKEPYDIWCNEPWNSQTPGGETIMQAGQRVFDEIRRIAEENDGKYIAIVSHGTVIRGVLTLACGLAPEQMMAVGWGDNTCVARLVYRDDGTIRVDYRNDNRHLPQELSTFHSLKWSDSVDVPISPQLWFRPVDFDKAEDRNVAIELFHSIYWPAYGKEAFTDEQIEQRLRGYQTVCPDAVSFGMYQSDIAGIIAMDTTAEEEDTIGEMGGTGILPQYRGWGFGPQLMNHAVSVYRRLGKRYLQSQPSAEGKFGPRFYHQNDFEEIGTTEDGKFLIMRRKIAAD
ncbi:MAG: histidine phosphatase family protein [Eubacteriales bacterium]|nr:histidine phosphatase family protein [Eubacteriales bacterium]